MLDAADEFMHSWTYWTYKSFEDITTQNKATETFFNEDGSLQSAKVRALSRTYAPSVATAEPASVRVRFDSESSNFQLSYNASPGGGETTIYANEALRYPSGVNVTLQAGPGVALSWAKPSPNTIVVMHKDTGASDQRSVDVMVKKM